MKGARDAKFMRKVQRVVKCKECKCTEGARGVKHDAKGATHGAKGVRGAKVQGM